MIPAGKFSTQLTACSRITYDYPDKPAFYGIIAPYYYLSDKVDVCLDIIPGYYGKDGDFGGTRAKGFALDLGPCLGFNIGDNVKPVYLVLSVPVYNVNRDAQVTIGIGLYYTIK